MVTGWPVMLTFALSSFISAPCPLEIVMPVELIAIDAPSEVFNVMPPLEPATSLSTMLWPPRVWRIIEGDEGMPFFASVGTSDDEPGKQPVQIG